MEVNENERLSKIKVGHKLKQRNSVFTAVCKWLFSIILSSRGVFKSSNLFNI